MVGVLFVVIQLCGRPYADEVRLNGGIESLFPHDVYTREHYRGRNAEERGDDEKLD